MHIRDSNKTGGACYTAEMPEFPSACRSLVHTWAVGGGVSKPYFHLPTMMSAASKLAYISGKICSSVEKWLAQEMEILAV